MAFPPMAVQESFVIIALSQVWGRIKQSIIDLEIQKCAAPPLCGPGDEFSIFYFIFHLILQMPHTELHPKSGGCKAQHSDL